MKLLAEGLQFEIPTSGVTKATLGLYKACMEIDPGVEARVLYRRELKCVLPSGIQSRRAGSNLHPRWWRRLVVPSYARLWKASIIHYPNGHFRQLSFGVPIVSTLHDLGIYHRTSGEEKERQHNRIQWELDRADMTITWSEYSKRDIMEHFRTQREPVVVPLAPYIPEDEPEPGIDIKKYGKYFIYTGGYWVYRKGLEALVHIHTELFKQGRVQSKLLLVGTKRPMTPEFDQLVEEAGEAGALLELGYVTNKELMLLYSGAVASVYPSRCEGFGLPPLEAMSVGCPVITTKCMSIPEVCDDAVCYVDPDDERGFAEAMVALENDSMLSEQLRVSGLKRASLFTWKSAAEKFLNEIERMSAERQRR